MRVVFAADHRGLALKEALKASLAILGHEVDDAGAFKPLPDDDYPDFAYLGATKVAADEKSLGVFLCGSGMGMDIVANKVKGIRATIVRTPDEAKYAREHDDVNVISLAADSLTAEIANEIVATFLGTSFSPLERHVRRVEKIRAIESEAFKS